MTQTTPARRIAKWIGTVLCLLIVCAFGFTQFRSISLSTSDWMTGMTGGGVIFRSWSLQMGPEFFNVTPRSAGMIWQPGWIGKTLYLPFWSIHIPILLFTTVLWRADRPRKVGQCDSCSYDLTGNQSGICPECGHRFRQADR